MAESYSDAYAAAHGRFAVVPAAYLILRRGEDALLQRRAGTGYYDGHWACGAAGHVEAGESVLTAAVREAAEEIGVVVAPEDVEFVTLLHRTDGSERAVEQRFDVFFQTARWSGEPCIREPEKTAELGWFPLGALPQPVVPHERLVLDALAAGFEPPVLTIGF